MKNAVSLLKEAFAEFGQDKAPQLAASLAYFTVFSLAPLLIVTLAVAGMFFDQSSVREEIINQVKATFGNGTDQMIIGMLDGANKNNSGVVATIVGLATALFGAAGLFGQLQSALNQIWEVAPKPGGGFLQMLKDRFLSFSMVLGIAFLLLVSLVLSTALHALEGWMNGIITMPAWTMQLLHQVIAFGIITLLFAVMFKVLPDVEIQWRDVWVGAALTAFLFAVGKAALSWYLGRQSFEGTYAAAASLVIVLLWTYYAAQILFFGAEFTQVWARRYGSKIVPSPNAVRVPKPTPANQALPEGVPSAQPVPQLVNAAQAATPTSSDPAWAGLSPQERQQMEKKLDVGFNLATLAGLGIGFLLNRRKNAREDRKLALQEAKLAEAQKQRRNGNRVIKA